MLEPWTSATDRDAWQRHRKKRIAFYQWIGAWGVTATPLYAALFKLKPHPSMPRWLDREAERGFLNRHRGVLGYPSMVLYSPTATAVAHGLCSHTPDTRPGHLAHMAQRTTIIHDLAAQHVAIQAQALAGRVLQVEHADEAHEIHPDAITSADEAIELELTQKQAARVYRTFLLYAAALRAGTIHRVKFVFVDRAIQASYLRLFAATEWPDYKFDDTQRKWVQHGEPFRVGSAEGFRSHFQFDLQPPMWPLLRP